MSNTNILTVDGKAYEIREFIPNRIANGFSNKSQEDGANAQLWFLSEMILVPKMSIEQVNELNKDTVAALFYSIAEKYQLYDPDLLDPELSKEDLKKKALMSQKLKMAELKKKVSWQ
jgi:hypothetical protein